MVRNFATELARKEPGKNWVCGFLKRNSNELKSTYLNGLDLNRKAAESGPNFQRYFNLVSAHNYVLESVLISIVYR